MRASPADMAPVSTRLSRISATVTTPELSASMRSNDVLQVLLLDVAARHAQRRQKPCSWSRSHASSASSPAAAAAGSSPTADPRAPRVAPRCPRPFVARRRASPAAVACRRSRRGVRSARRAPPRAARAVGARGAAPPRPGVVLARGSALRRSASSAARASPSEWSRRPPGRGALARAPSSGLGQPRDRRDALFDAGRQVANAPESRRAAMLSSRACRVASARRNADHIPSACYDSELAVARRGLREH